MRLEVRRHTKIFNSSQDAENLPGIINVMGSPWRIGMRGNVVRILFYFLWYFLIFLSYTYILILQ